jgi:hypothetical protein
LTATGCAGASSQSVTVFPAPTIDAGPDVSVCQSTTVQICATGGATYAWTPAFGLSDTTIACPQAGPTSNTTYIVYGTTVNGCTSSDTVSVNLYPLPSVPVISRNVAVLTSTPASSYQWYFNSAVIPGATSQSYTPTQNGNYFVTVTDTNGCQSTSATYVMNDVSVQEAANINPVAVYPDPNNGNFTVQFDQKGLSAEMEVFGVNGKKVYGQHLAANGFVTKQLRLSADPGIYFIRIVLSDGTTFSQRMIIEN